MNDAQLTDKQIHPTYPTDLFDSPSAWVSTPEKAFDAWLSSHNPAPSTFKVRMSMWNKFTRHLNQQSVSIVQCEAKHLNNFIAAARLEKEQGWRYVKLVERVYDHLIMIGVATQNPGRIAAKNDFQIKKNDPMRFLSPEERKVLEDYLSGELNFAEMLDPNRLKVTMKPGDFEDYWLALRDIVVTAVIVGAGVKIHELGRLSVNCTSVEKWLPVPGTKIHPKREALMLPQAARAIKAWSRFRATETDLGDPLFPALISRRRHDQRVVSSVMHASTMFRRVNRLLEGLGIKQARSCGQTLRNTYAAELIEAGMNDEQIIKAMGYYGDFSIQRLRAEYEGFYRS